jgi:hypothetical protein
MTPSRTATGPAAADLIEAVPPTNAASRERLLVGDPFGGTSVSGGGVRAKGG